MADYILVKYIHLLAIFGMLSFLVAELMLVKRTLTRGDISKLSKLDGLYGLMSILAVGAGLTLWFGVGKPAEFYDNPVFHIKVGLVVIVGLLSIAPTVYYIKQRKGDHEELIAIPAYVRRFIILQILILASVPLLAIVMAQGVRF
ncbi:MAG: putative membrane protein [Cyclobacteriaceae bacterium]|jgi:putative membrane protein